jgi:cysteine desulfurase
MIAALELREAALAKREHEQRAKVRDGFVTTLGQVLHGAEVVGINQPRLWNTVSALMPEANARQRWVVKLDKLGFAVSSGSACASGKEAPSHVISAMGYSPAEATRALRFSSGWETTPEEWDSLGEALEKVFHEMRMTKPVSR